MLPELFSTTELLTRQFYDWERRGRGWQVYDEPVHLEPPFTPFCREVPLGRSGAARDDGRKETWASAIAERLKSYWGAREPLSAHVPAKEEEIIVASDDDPGEPRSEIAVVLPAAEDVSREAAEQLVLSLSTCPSPVTFEIVGTPEAISVQFSCRKTEAEAVAQQVTAYFPEAVVDERDDHLAGAWQAAAWHDRLIVDFGLSYEFMRPLRTFRNFAVDPLIGVAGALSDVRSGEVAVLQVLFRSCRILFDPSDDQYPVGFNILSAHSELEKTLLASDLAAIFKRFSTSFGDQMQAVLSNAILAILENDRGGTLLDLRRFLTEKPFREEYLQSVTDPEIAYYFAKEFPLLKGSPQAPILTRLNTFLRPKPIRYMVAQREGLDFSGIMNDGKIFLAKLAHGLIGEENSYLLGALLVTKFHQLAMGRQEMAASGRRPFTLFIDEFHNFVTPSVTSILSAARKYRLGLVLAHQEMRQLWDQDAAVGSAVLTNPCTRICFRVGDWDAKKLAEGFSSFNASDLQSLGVGEAICRVERAEHDFTLMTHPAPSVDPTLAEARRDEIVRRSRVKYARPRAEVEALLVAARTDTATDEPREMAKARQPESTPAAPLVPASPPPTDQPAEATRVVTPEKKPRLSVVAPPVLGRGGREHKYLQHLVKRLAEDRGYHAVIEQPILSGAGSVDVSLERGERRIACEISVTTDTDHEIDNIQKCLAGGYEMVVALSSDLKVIRRLKERAAAVLEPETRERVRFLQPEDLVLFLDELAAGDASGKTTIRGYRVKRRYQAVSPEEQEVKKQAIAQVLGGRRPRGTKT